jgi:hypothetical protein
VCQTLILRRCRSSVPFPTLLVASRRCTSVWIGYLEAVKGGADSTVSPFGTLCATRNSDSACTEWVTTHILLRTGRVSVVIRRLVHHSWYVPAGERPSPAGTGWKGSAGRGPAIRTRQALDRRYFPTSISISSLPR